jgi:quercetin dioxygenase-like cupin family protein
MPLKKVDRIAFNRQGGSDMEPISDVLEAAANAYELLMENERVRVLAIRLKPGEKAPMHNHPSDHVVYVLNDAKFRLTFPDGKSDDIDLNSGLTLWLEAGAHEAENIGNTDGHNLVVEIKK